MKRLKKFLSVALSGAIILGCSAIGGYATEDKRRVYLGGEPFGVKFYNNGLIVVELENYFDGSRYVCPAKKAGIKVNDIITEADGRKIESNEDLQKAAYNSNGKEIKLKITRQGKETEKSIKPEKNTSGAYLIGVWVRDSCAGIGTITYYNEDDKSFAALGHGICDNDTGAMLPLGYAQVVKANISGITKSASGKAGSLNGYFTDTDIGNLTKNSEIGIYGTATDEHYDGRTEIEIAQNSEIKCGEAEIFTTVRGEKPQSYDIEITRICNYTASSNENFVIKITDERLENDCGGIVRGMSGSPIVQNGKLVGAVTHVFVNNPLEGYGVTAQNMASNYTR